MAVFKSEFVSKVRVAIWILIHLFDLDRVDYLVSLPGTALSQTYTNANNTEKSTSHTKVRGG